jgi:hypothetical protein
LANGRTTGCSVDRIGCCGGDGTLCAAGGTDVTPLRGRMVETGVAAVSFAAVSLTAVSLAVNSA